MLQSVTYMPAVSILEHSGTETPNSSNRHPKIPGETDTSLFSHTSYFRDYPVHDRHRDLRQTKELTEPRKLDSIHKTHRFVSRTRLFCINRLQRCRNSMSWTIMLNTMVQDLTRFKVGLLLLTTLKIQSFKDILNFEASHSFEASNL